MALNEARTLQIIAKLTDEFTRPLSKVERAMSTFGVVAKRSLAAAAIGFTAMSTAAVAGFRALLQFSEGLDALAKASDNLGITAESLTAIRDAAALAGVTLDQLGVSMKSFSKVVDEANAGGKKQRELLEQLGLQARDFTGDQLDVVEVLSKVADGLENIGSATQRTRILLDLFGKSGTVMGALLKGGGDEIRRLAEEAGKLGAVFTREQLQDVEDFIDSFDKLKQALRSLAEVVIVNVAPAFTEFFETLRKAIVEKGAEIGIQLRSLVSIIIDGLELLTGGVRRMLQIVEGFNSILQFANLVRLAVLNAFHDIAGNEAAMERTQTEIANAKARFLELVEVLRALDNAGDDTARVFDNLRAQISALTRASATDLDQLAANVKKATDVPKPTAWQKYWDGFTQGAREAEASWTNFFEAGEQGAKALIDGGLNALVDGIASFIDSTKTAKQAALDFLNSLLSMLAKVIAKLIVVEGLSLLGFGAKEGGVLPAAKGGVRPMASGGLNRNGGIATRPTILFGEGSNAEAFVPLPDNRTIPVTLTGGSGGTINYTFNIQAMDGKDVQRVLVEQQTTLRSIWQNQAETRIGMRQIIQRVR